MRRALFYDMLPDRRFSAEVFTVDSRPAARAVYRMAMPLLVPAMRSSMSIDRDGAEAGRARTVAALDRVEDELEPEGYMVGGAFTVADLTAAALLSPLVRPAQFSYRLPDRWPDVFEAFRDSVRDHPAFGWVVEMYRRHRGKSAALND